MDFASVRSDLARRPGLDGPGRRAAMTASADEWLRELFAMAVGNSSSTFCLVAVGGYGRGDLALGSDLDLVLVHRAGAAEATQVADLLWYPVWDSGVRLDHSVRTVAEARRMASDDLKVVLGMVDSRVVAGNPELGAGLSQAVLSDWRAMASKRLPELKAMVDARRSRLGEASQLLEPDIKECFGGLRDASVLRGIAASWVTDIPHSGWEESVTFLLDVRDALHLTAGRPTDRLLMQEQDGVAAEMGFADADALLRAVYEAARDVAYASDVAWHRVERLGRRQPRLSFRPISRGGAATRLPLADGVVVQDGEVVLALDAHPDRDPGLLLRAAAAAAQAALPLSPHTVDRLVAECPPVDWTAQDRESFVALLGAGAGLVPVWEALDQAGIISRLIPGWDVVRSAPQRNALHRFTVDRHLIEAAIQACAFTRHVDRPDLLLLGALLHDIGKGQPGDHSLVGQEIAVRLMRMWGFDEHDVDVVAALVRHHLLLADTATRRDLDDPAVITAVAQALMSVEVVELLAELSIADSLATGPAVCSEWRFSLIQDLADRVSRTLHGRPLTEPPELSEHQRVALEQQGVWTLMDIGESEITVTVAAPDRVGLLSMVAGVLSLNRLNVLSARISTVGDRAVQEWVVRPAFGDPPSFEQLSDEVRRAIDGTYDVAAKLAKRDADHPLSTRTQYPEPVIEVTNAASQSTIVEVRAHDAPGLLHRAAAALSQTGATIVGAKVATLGADAVDVFFVMDTKGQQLTSKACEDVRAHLQAALR